MLLSGSHIDVAHVAMQINLVREVGRLTEAVGAVVPRAIRRLRADSPHP
jgi:hypothetical protein